MKRFLLILSSAFLVPTFFSSVLAQTLTLKEQVQTDEGKICVYSNGAHSEKIVMETGNACPETRVVNK